MTQRMTAGTGLIPALKPRPRIMPAKPAADATDRSRPPVRITKVMPMARMKITDWARNMFMMLPQVRNRSSVTAR